MKQGRTKDREPVTGRRFVLVIVIVTSALSFTLGYFVGKAGENERKPQPQIVIERAQPETVSMAQEQPVQAGGPQATVPPQPQHIKEEKVLSEKPLPAVQPPVIKKETEEKKAKEVETAKDEIKYTVQAGAFRNLKEAETLKKKLEGKGLKAYVKKAAVDKNIKLFKVRTGEFNNKEDAEILANKLKKDGLKAFVTPKNEEARAEKTRAAK